MSYIRHNPLMEIVYTTYREDAKDFEYYFHMNNESYCGNEWYEEKYLDKIIDDIENLKDIVVEHRGPRCDFKDYVERLQELEFFLKEGNEDLESDEDRIERTMIYNKYSFIKEAVDKLGYNKIKSLRYIQKDIKSELEKINNSTSEKDIPIYELIEKNIPINTFIISKELKIILNGIYSELNLGKAKASDIKKYYNIKELTRTINGKATRGYIINK